MNLREVHDNSKEVSAKSVFQSQSCKVAAIQILENGVLKEHITKSPALLLCLNGEVIYEDENDQKITLRSGDYFEITPLVKHWLRCISKCQLVLVK